MRGGEVATPDLLAAARRIRDEGWADLRSSCLGERPLPASAERRTDNWMKAAPSTMPRGLDITGEADTGKSRTMKAFRDAYPAV